MKTAALIATRNRPDLVEAMVSQLRRLVKLPLDIYVVECGSDPDKLSPHTSVWYPDPDFRGKCFGHNVALRFAQAAGHYDYFWVLMNDLVFPEGQDPLAILQATMQSDPRLGILSPIPDDQGYPGSQSRPQGGWQAVTTCDYLGFLMRNQALEEVGFLNPAFKYCWGAIHELSFKLYQAGWKVGYSSDTSYHHLGGSTYGQKGTATISREAYQHNARRFAYEYFYNTYGKDWDIRFWAYAAHVKPPANTYRLHKQVWEKAFQSEELANFQGVPYLPPPPSAPVRLHLGCGPQKRPGWVNVDLNPMFKPDLVSEAHRLPSLQDRSVDQIEALHLFEHLTFNDAQRALKEWFRVLKSGGYLCLEVPEIERCFKMLGHYTNEEGYDLGEIGIFGYPPMIETEGSPQQHKWGWTEKTLTAALKAVGFEEIHIRPSSQQWRGSFKYGRDFRIEAIKPRAWPLNTKASHCVLVWPDYSTQDLEALGQNILPGLLNRPDCALIVRHDPQYDPPDALDRLQTMFNHYCPDATLDVVWLNEKLSPQQWPLLGRAIQAVSLLPSSTEAPRAAFYAALRPTP